MTQAQNHQTIIDGCRSHSEFDASLKQAKNMSIAEEDDANDLLCDLEFSDGSILRINLQDMTASIE